MMTIHTPKVDWLNSLSERIPDYLTKLQVNQRIGRYHPATSGLTSWGEDAALGFSCYALKIHYMLGLWETLSNSDQTQWIHYIQSFQTDHKGAFIDPPVTLYLATNPKRGWTFRLKERVQKLLQLRDMNRLERAIHAETKQASATLLEIGVKPRHPYQDFPRTAAQLNHHLTAMNWENPWSAGAHTTTIAVFLEAIKGNGLSVSKTDALKEQLSQFISQTLDAETGTYFIAPQTPAYDNLINGAMKVLTTLDWLNVPIHAPENLIDTTLSQLPSSEGCHIVDAIYVLYRCAQQTDYRRHDIQSYCVQVLDMAETHYVEEDGAFSYFTGKSQTSYYGVPITQGNPVADIHGTILLTWALSMIFSLLEQPHLPEWKIIKP